METKRKENKVFLGGTCNETAWRQELIKMLKINYFNPVVEDWTPDCQLEEERQKLICKWQLYVITPKMTGCFSIAEAVDNSNKDPKHTIFCVLTEDELDGETVVFDEGDIRSLKAVEKMITNNGGIVLDTLEEIAEYLNSSLIS